MRRPLESTQYTSLIFTRRCRSVGIEVSMGSRGDCFDNSAIESFHATLKKDLIHRRSWPTKAEARTAVFEYIEASVTAAAGTRDSACARLWSSRTALSWTAELASPLSCSRHPPRSD
jgi:integrase-like protein